MNSTECRNRAENVLMHTYGRYPVVLDHGDGVYLYDTDGKQYLDFSAGIGVFALGYNNTAYNDALKAQIDKLLHTSNYYYNVPAIEAAKKLLLTTSMPVKDIASTLKFKEATYFMRVFKQKTGYTCTSFKRIFSK